MKIFISYRRKTGIDIAARIHDYFYKKEDCTVFFDVQSMQLGDFKPQIVENIKQSDYFILLLTEGALESEWVLKEIKCALETPTLKIVPILMPDFVVPEHLPNDIKNALDNHGIIYNSMLFDLVMDKLYSMLNGNGKKEVNPNIEDIKIFKAAYDYAISFKEALRYADQDLINNVTPKLSNSMRQLFDYYEKNRINKPELAQKAFEIVNYWNEFGKYYNAFASSADRSSKTAQEYAMKAEEVFGQIENLLIEAINSIK